MQRQLRRAQPHIQPSTAGAAAAVDFSQNKKNRGNYNCGRCGLPKKGHVCQLPADVAPPKTPIPSTTFVNTACSASSTRSSIRSLPPQPPSRPASYRRRALSFDDFEDSEVQPHLHDAPTDLVRDSDMDVDLESDLVLETCGLPALCLWEVLRRLPPSRLLTVARVCKGWEKMARRIWGATEELRIRIPAKAQVAHVTSLLQKCLGLLRLSLKMESDMDTTMWACIAFSCPNLEVLEIKTFGAAVNRITGAELGRFVAERRCLKSLKMEGCSNLGGFTLRSSSLSTLWLSDLHSLSKMVFNCPNLIEVSLEFSRQENDTTDLVAVVGGLGSTCTRLQNIHIASSMLSHSVVLALAAANWRELQMLSLPLGSEITDASVAAITSSYSNLELLDLSGSSISDSGIGMICNALPDTLSKLLLALCPNITSSGIQFATAQLPLLELMDCGMTICENTSEDLTSIEPDLTKPLNNKQHVNYQKLLIKHSLLKKLSLWGCSSLDALYLNCPKLIDLNLNLCDNLNPESLLLQCPRLESVHASGCQEALVVSIRNQISENSDSMETHMPAKRLADGSKRVQAPQFLYQQTPEEGSKKRKRGVRNQCKVIIN